MKSYRPEKCCVSWVVAVTIGALPSFSKEWWWRHAIKEKSKNIGNFLIRKSNDPMQHRRSKLPLLLRQRPHLGWGAVRKAVQDWTGRRGTDGVGSEAGLEILGPYLTGLVLQVKPRLIWAAEYDTSTPNKNTSAPQQNIRTPISLMELTKNTTPKDVWSISQVGP